MNILKGIFRFIAALLLMILGFSCIPLVAYTMRLLIKDLGILYGIFPAAIACLGIMIVAIGCMTIAGDLMGGKRFVDIMKDRDIIGG